MENEILESQLEDAFEVKSKKSLHNYVTILASNILERNEVSRRFSQIESQIKLLAETMKMGFENVDKRFEDVNRRFEDMNKRFEDMNNRLEDVNKKVGILIWVFSIWMTLFTSLAVFLKLFQ